MEEDTILSRLAQWHFSDSAGLTTRHSALPFLAMNYSLYFSVVSWAELLNSANCAESRLLEITRQPLSLKYENELPWSAAALIYDFQQVCDGLKLSIVLFPKTKTVWYSLRYGESSVYHIVFDVSDLSDNSIYVQGTKLDPMVHDHVKSAFRDQITDNMRKVLRFNQNDL